MVVSKSVLSKMVRFFSAFDPAAASPFVALQLLQTPTMHRSSSNGFVESVGFLMTEPKVIVSLPDLRDRLSIMPEGDLTLRINTHGILNIRSEIGPTELCVHTTRPDNAWGKQHSIGNVKSVLAPTMFSGVTIPTSFNLATPPVISKGRLMLATNHGGVAFRSGFDTLVFPYPREALVRTIGGVVADTIQLTEAGYWDVRLGENRVVVAGHRTGEALFNTYDKEVPKHQEYPAPRLIQAINAACSLAGEGHLVFKEESIQVTDQYGSVNKFGIGPTSEFTLASKTAKVLAEILSQDTAEVVGLGRMNTEVLQFSRGAWVFNAKQIGERK